MKVELRYGSKNTKGKLSQSIYIRIKHSNLDWDKSLRIQISASDWNFKKQEIITQKSFNNPIHSQYLQDISRKVYDVSKNLQYKAESFYHSNRMEVLQWVQEKNRKRFRELCEKWYSEYKNQNKVVTQPFFTEAFNEAKEHLASTIHKKDTRTRWDNIGKNIEAYMKAKGNIRTDEFSSKEWKNMVKFFREEYRHSDNQRRIGLSDETISTLLKKIRTVRNQLGNKYIFHYDMGSFKLKKAKRTFNTLNEEEFKRFLDFSCVAEKIHKTNKRKWFFQIQYYGCFRITEIYLNLKKNPTAKNSQLKTPEEIWKNEVFKSKNAKGEDVYIWKCFQVKQTGEITNKNLPIHSKLAECLFGSIASALSDTFPKELTAYNTPIEKLESEVTYRRFMKNTLKELGIDKHILTHDIRKSFLTNERKKRIQKSDLMQYSGHESEEAFNIYINESDNYIPTEVNLYE